LNLAPPDGRVATKTDPQSKELFVIRRDRLGGLLHEYQRAA
jgi:hypothetical protein